MHRHPQLQRASSELLFLGRKAAPLGQQRLNQAGSGRLKPSCRTKQPPRSAALLAWFGARHGPGMVSKGQAGHEGMRLWDFQCFHETQPKPCGFVSPKCASLTQPSLCDPAGCRGLETRAHTWMCTHLGWDKQSPSPWAVDGPAAGQKPQLDIGFSTTKRSTGPGHPSPPRQGQLQEARKPEKHLPGEGGCFTPCLGFKKRFGDISVA